MIDFFKLLKTEIEGVSELESNDRKYFEFHKNRCERFNQFLDSLAQRISYSSDSIKVMEIGTPVRTLQFFWQIAPSKLNMDVEEVLQLDFVRKRAEKYYDLNPSHLIFKVLSKIGNITLIFAEDWEVIVRLKQKRRWCNDGPKY